MNVTPVNSVSVQKKSSSSNKPTKIGAAAGVCAGFAYSAKSFARSMSKESKPIIDNLKMSGDYNKFLLTMGLTSAIIIGLATAAGALIGKGAGKIAEHIQSKNISNKKNEDIPKVN